MFLSIAAASLVLLMQAPATSVEGRVVSTSGKAVPGAKVTATFLTNPVTGATGAKPQTQTSSATTDVNGHFVFRRLAPGTYFLRAEADDYIRADSRTPLNRPYGQTAQVNLMTGQTVSNIEFHLVPGGTITGKVTGTDGQPVANIQVSLLRATYSPEGSKRMAQEWPVQTNDRGEYRLSGLSPGQY
jgi:protocatechuate 3,4-dioxygenase beta subunit